MNEHDEATRKAVEKLKKARLRCQNILAERALTRGRKLTPSEKIANLEREFGFAPGFFRRVRELRDGSNDNERETDKGVQGRPQGDREA